MRTASVWSVICLSLLVRPPLSSGQSSSWVGTGGPSGGIGYDIKARPDNPDVMYVTDSFAGVHKSTDGGLTWASINQGIDARQGPSQDQIPAFCVTIDPNNPSVVWVGLQELSGIYRSADGGATWEKRTKGIVETTAFTVRGIAVQAGNSNVVYAAGEIGSDNWAGRHRNGRQFDLVKGVVYKSTDGGQNWAAVWRGDNLARYVIIDPTNANTVYVSTGIFDREAANSSPELNAAGGVGVLKSTDGGASWTAINSGLGNLYVGSLAMHPTNPRTLLAGTGNNAYESGGGLYLTTDAGSTWQYVAGRQITSVRFSTSNPSIGYASGEREFFRSSDGGQTWRAFLNRNGRTWGPAGVLTGFPIDMHVDPRDSLRVFVNNYGGGNFLTRDGGASWTLASDGYTGAGITDLAVSRQNAAVTYANTKTGPAKTTNGGGTWFGINTVDPEPMSAGGRVAVDPEDASHVLMSSAHEGLTYESLDGGVTWRLTTDYRQELTALSANAPTRFQQGVQAFVFAPSSRTKVYAGFGYQPCVLTLTDCDTPTILGVLTSEDGGRTWTRRSGTGLDSATVPAIAVHPLDRNVAWAATMGSGIFKTTDGGAHWTPSSTGLTNLTVESLAVDPTRPEILFAGTASSGIFKSRDGGATWTLSGSGVTGEIKALVVNPVQPDTLYAGSFSVGVYASTNGGSSWSLINAGLRNRSVRALAISKDGTVLYAGTFGGGVFRLGSVPEVAGVPGAPAGLASSLSGSTVTITWSAPSTGGTPTTYVIEAGSSAAGTDIANFSTGSTATSFSATVGNSGTFYVRVRAANSFGASAPSNEIVITLGSGAQAPGAPGSLTAAVAGSAVTLTWSAPQTGGAVASYILEAGSATGLTDLANFSTGNTATTFSTSGVPPGTYFVRIRASNALGASTPSNEVVVTVQ